MLFVCFDFDHLTKSNSNFKQTRNWNKKKIDKLDWRSTKQGKKRHWNECKKINIEIGFKLFWQNKISRWVAARCRILDLAPKHYQPLARHMLVGFHWIHFWWQNRSQQFFSSSSSEPETNRTKAINQHEWNNRMVPVPMKKKEHRIIEQQWKIENNSNNNNNKRNGIIRNPMCQEFGSNWNTRNRIKWN